MALTPPSWHFGPLFGNPVAPENLWENASPSITSPRCCSHLIKPWSAANPPHTAWDFTATTFEASFLYQFCQQSMRFWGQWVQFAVAFFRIS